MLKVGLVDDREIDLDKMRVIIENIPEVEIIFATTSAEEAYKQIKKEEINLLIADIEMPKLSGYELADIIHSHALNISVIFVTANSGYAVHAFELQVHDYIMKPYTKERLIQSVERLKEKTRVPILPAAYILNRRATSTLYKRRILFLLNGLAVPQRFIRNQEQLKPIRPSMNWKAN